MRTCSRRVWLPGARLVGGLQPLSLSRFGHVLGLLGVLQVPPVLQQRAAQVPHPLVDGFIQNHRLGSGVNVEENHSY
jgi:hypothetical protein